MVFLTPKYRFKVQGIKFKVKNRIPISSFPGRPESGFIFSCFAFARISRA
jgi:hypothetical protein